MQTQVADKIEKKLQELPYLDRVESYSQPGTSFIQVYLIDRTPPAKVKDLWYQVRKKVGDIKGELPSGVIGPNFNDEYGDVYSTIYMLTADGLSRADLKARAEDIRQRLLRVPDVNKVDLIGEHRKIFIEFSHAKSRARILAESSTAWRDGRSSGGSVETSADRINLACHQRILGRGRDRRRSRADGRPCFRLATSRLSSVAAGPAKLHRPKVASLRRARRSEVART